MYSSVIQTIFLRCKWYRRLYVYKCLGKGSVDHLKIFWIHHCYAKALSVDHRPRPYRAPFLSRYKWTCIDLDVKEPQSSIQSNKLLDHCVVNVSKFGDHDLILLLAWSNLFSIGTSKLFASFKYRMQRYAGSDDEKRYIADRLLSGRHFSREDGGADVRALADSSDVDHQDCCRL